MLPQVVDDLGDLRLELSDVHGSGVHLRRGCLEDDELLDRRSRAARAERRLPDARLPDEQD